MRSSNLQKLRENLNKKKQIEKQTEKTNKTVYARKLTAAGNK